LSRRDQPVLTSLYESDSLLSVPRSFFNNIKPRRGPNVPETREDPMNWISALLAIFTMTFGSVLSPPVALSLQKLRIPKVHFSPTGGGDGGIKFYRMEKGDGGMRSALEQQQIASEQEPGEELGEEPGEEPNEEPAEEPEEEPQEEPEAS
jgi:hypothetical protein